MNHKKNGIFCAFNLAFHNLKWLFAALLISFLFACGGRSPDESEATVEGALNMQVPSIEMTDQGSLIPFQMVASRVNNLVLDNKSYSGFVDQNPVTLVLREDKSLGWIVPNLPPGKHTLKVNIGTKTLSANLTIVSAPAVYDAYAYVKNIASEYIESLDKQISKLSESTDQEAATQELIKIRGNFLEHVAAYERLSEDEKKWLANYLHSNLTVISSEGPTSATTNHGSRAMARSFNEEECELHAKLFSNSVIKTIKFTHIIVALSSYELMLASQPELSAVVAGFTIGSFAFSLKNTLDLEDATLEKCVGKLGSETLKSLNNTQQQSFTYLVSKSVAPSALAIDAPSNLVFIDNKTQYFDIVTTRSILNASVKSSIESLNDALSPIFSIVPSGWLPVSWVDRIRSTSTENNITISDPATYLIGGISDPSIQTSAKAVGKAFAVTFKHASQTLNDTKFTFELTDSRDGKITNYSAVLKGLTPNLSISPEYVSLELGKNYQLVAIAKDNNGAFVELPPNLIWSSSNPSAISVNSSGQIVGISKGSADIFITDPYSKAKSPSVSISTFATVMAVSPSTAARGASQVFTVTGRNLPSDTNFTLQNCSDTVQLPGGTSETRKFSCTPTATGDHTGVISSAALVADFQFSVKITETILSINYQRPSIPLNSSLQLIASAFNQFGQPIPPPLSLSWSSSDDSIATVSPNGVVQGVRFGSATITVLDPTSTATAFSKVTIGCLSGSTYCNKELNWVTGIGAEHDWNAANNYCSNLSVKGASGWRLPSEPEVKDFIEKDGMALYSYTWTSTVGPITTYGANGDQMGHLGVLGRGGAVSYGFPDINPGFNMIFFCVRPF